MAVVALPMRGTFSPVARNSAMRLVCTATDDAIWGFSSLSPFPVRSL